ncbi:MAG: hypothetical protein EBR82_02855 [Caulobacteraceae bacterium]|nr:hypothetical protein [Caulobacteraceae bacterium]
MDETDWHLQEWMGWAEKIQADLVRELGWTKRKASEVYNGEQQFKRDTVLEIAKWLGIAPYELLMRPSEALQLRQFRSAAFAIAAEAGRDFTPAPKAPSPSRTRRPA